MPTLYAQTVKMEIKVEQGVEMLNMRGLCMLNVEMQSTLSFRGIKARYVLFLALFSPVIFPFPSQLNPLNSQLNSHSPSRYRRTVPKVS